MSKKKSSAFFRVHPRPISFVSIGAALVALILLLGLGAGAARAAVTLVSFTPAPGDGEVMLTWETATEFDNAGFFVQRSSQENSGYARISSFIPSTGSGLTGGTYTYTDRNLTNGVTYYYKLESLSNNQQSEFFGPVSATPGAGTANTPTSTQPSGATSSPTFTPTNTSTQAEANTQTPTLTRTQSPSTRTPTLTPFSAYPAPATTPAPLVATTLVPLPTNTLQVVANAGTSFPTQEFAPGAPTDTLVPFPTVNLVFIQPTATINLSTLSNPPSPTPQSEGSGGMPRLGPILLILLIWVILGGWLFFSLRKLG